MIIIINNDAEINLYLLFYLSSITIKFFFNFIHKIDKENNTLIKFKT